MAGEPELVADLGAELGEGALWDGRDASLWFTDIKRRRVYRYHPATHDLSSWNAPAEIGFVVPAQSGGFIAGLQGGLHRFDPESGRFELLAAVEADRPGNRLNDAAVDPAGRLWFGSMDNAEEADSGAFYCFHRGELHVTGLDGICITNGPAISPDGSTLYWVDTLGRAIFECAIRADGALGASRQLIAIAPADGHPDGPTVDSEGCLWIGLYGGWAARRYSPAGDLLESVAFPVGNITKLAFGGDDMRTVFATTASQKLTADELSKQPKAGGLFRFRTEVAGLASPAVADR
ncbi:SMP-30/gluconolactonase/LRE family protein [Sphingomonas sabuli]|uniref:SMP-30/gluconolactonase/LRE family protein n=1 Tax=Sphingomonas sabuli TaxID=2764186 RepID=A0A7G9L5Z0_9SPHN|nr:SMP-30/gluconolactonase/LRE family protein [Sphingomonas sabuli]QNM84039.1 SMP-30/gluconolactonase/LRE family protein [Sphingomonas sabuli]